MVSIPRAGQGTTKLSVAAPSVKQDPGANSQFNQMAANVGGAIAELGNKMKDLNDLRDFTKAKTDATRAMMEIKRQAEQDETPWDMSAKYNVALEEAVNNAAGQIKNPMILEQYKASVGMDMMKSQFEIGVIEQKAQLSEAKAVLEDAIENQHDKYYSTSLPNERQAIEAETRIMVEAFANKGGIYGEAAKDMVDDQIEAMRLTAVDYDLDKNLQATIEELQLGEEGKYKDVPQSVRDEKLDLGEKMLRHRESVAILMNKIETNKNDVMMMKLVKEGKASVAMIEDAMMKGLERKKGAMSSTVGKALIKALTTKVDIDRSAVEKASKQYELDMEFDKLFLKEKDGSNELAASSGWGNKKTTLDNIAKWRESVILAQAEGYIEEGTAASKLRKVEEVLDGQIDAAVKARWKQESNMWDGLKSIFSEQSKNKLNNIERLSVIDKLTLRERLDKRLMAIAPSKEITPQQQAQIVNEIATDLFNERYPELLGRPLPGGIYSKKAGYVDLSSMLSSDELGQLEAQFNVDPNGVWTQVGEE